MEWFRHFENKLINLSIDFKDKVMQPYYSLLLNEDIKFQKIISDKWSKNHLVISGSETFQRESISSKIKKSNLDIFPLILKTMLLRRY